MGFHKKNTRKLPVFFVTLFRIVSEWWAMSLLASVGSLKTWSSRKKKWRRGKSFACYNPIGSMYGIFTYIYHKNQPNVGIYTIHGSYGNSSKQYILPKKWFTMDSMVLLNSKVPHYD